MAALGLKGLSGLWYDIDTHHNVDSATEGATACIENTIHIKMMKNHAHNTFI